MKGVTREKTVIHIDIAHFAVAVERQMDKGLKGRPILIAHAGAQRTPVYDMSEEAFSCGIRKGMPILKALKQCRECRVISPHPARYEQAMNLVAKHAGAYTPLVEPGVNDGHLFMDVTGTGRLFGPPVDVAWRLEKEIRKTIETAPAWSVAPNKLVAKVATRLVKPTGEYIVGAGEEESLIEPLPLALIPGILPDEQKAFSDFHISKVIELKQWRLDQLKIPFGDRARFLYEAIRGIDPTPVTPPTGKEVSIVMDHSFSEDTNTMAHMEQALYALVEKGGRLLRRTHRFAGVLGVTLSYSDGLREARQVSIRPPASTDPALFKSARHALALALKRRVRVTHLRLTLKKLFSPPIEQDLFDMENREREGRLITALDLIREKFGDASLMTGRMMA